MRAEKVLFLAVAALCLGMACERESSRAFECASPENVQELVGVHYEGVDCEGAIRSAESRLTTAYYRKACEQLAPDAGVPARVSDAYVSHCEPATGDVDGSILSIQVCCR